MEAVIPNSGIELILQTDDGETTSVKKLKLDAQAKKVVEDSC